MCVVYSGENATVVCGVCARARARITCQQLQFRNRKIMKRLVPSCLNSSVVITTDSLSSFLPWQILDLPVYFVCVDVQLDSYRKRSHTDTSDRLNGTKAR